MYGITIVVCCSMLIVVVVLEFEQSEFSVNENDGSITISLTLEENELRVPISVQLSVEDISASMLIHEHYIVPYHVSILLYL